MSVARIEKQRQSKSRGITHCSEDITINHKLCDHLLQMLAHEKGAFHFLSCISKLKNLQNK